MIKGAGQKETGTRVLDTASKSKEENSTIWFTVTNITEIKGAILFNCYILLQLHLQSFESRCILPDGHLNGQSLHTTRSKEAVHPHSAR